MTVPPTPKDEPPGLRLADILFTSGRALRKGDLVRLRKTDRIRVAGDAFNLCHDLPPPPSVRIRFGAPPGPGLSRQSLQKHEFHSAVLLFAAHHDGSRWIAPLQVAARWRWIAGITPPGDG